MGEYLKYLTLIGIGMCVINIWNYIKALETANSVLANDIMVKLKQHQEKQNDSE